MSYSEENNESIGLEARFGDAGFSDLIMTRIASLHEAWDQGDACERLEQIAHLIGCKNAAFATFIANDPWHQSYRFLLACHKSWCAKYQSLAWFADDPWLDYARTNFAPARDYEIPCRTTKQTEIVELARSFGVQSALIVPSPSGGGLSRLGVLMLGANEPGYFDVPPAVYGKVKAIGRALCAELHDWTTANMRSELMESAKLTEADLSLLRHERAGMSSKEIERVSGVSRASIDSRFQRIMSRLRVPSRRAAAVLAAEHGLI